MWHHASQLNNALCTPLHKQPPNGRMWVQLRLLVMGSNGAASLPPSLPDPRKPSQSPPHIDAVLGGHAAQLLGVVVGAHAAKVGGGARHLRRRRRRREQRPTVVVSVARQGIKRRWRPTQVSKPSAHPSSCAAEPPPARPPCHPPPQHPPAASTALRGSSSAWRRRQCIPPRISPPAPAAGSSSNRVRCCLRNCPRTACPHPCTPAVGGRRRQRGARMHRGAPCKGEGACPRPGSGCQPRAALAGRRQVGGAGLLHNDGALQRGCIACTQLARSSMYPHPILVHQRLVHHCGQVQQRVARA